METLTLDRSRTRAALARAATMALEAGDAPVPAGELRDLANVLMDDNGIVASSDPVAAAHVLALAYHGISLSHPARSGRPGLASVVIACPEAGDAARLRSLGHEATTLFAFKARDEHTDLVIAIGLGDEDVESRRRVMASPLSTRIIIIEPA